MYVYAFAARIDDAGSGERYVSAGTAVGAAGSTPARAILLLYLKFGLTLTLLRTC